jgi:GrpB-like predicted nucleotidyltransferase (UPF0157 family)
MPMIEILPWQPDWPRAYASEAAELRALVPAFHEIEHIGSTAVPGLAAKPVIDMMAAVIALDAAQRALPALAARGYALIDAGMRNRFFVQRPGDPAFNLHIVTIDSWPTRKERLMRDALIADPQAMAEYATLKRDLAAAHGDDIVAYTRAKTAFVQRIMDGVHDRLGLPRKDVWED